MQVYLQVDDVTRMLDLLRDRDAAVATVLSTVDDLKDTLSTSGTSEGKPLFELESLRGSLSKLRGMQRAYKKLDLNTKSLIREENLDRIHTVALWIKGVTGAVGGVLFTVGMFDRPLDEQRNIVLLGGALMISTYFTSLVQDGVNFLRRDLDASRYRRASLESLGEITRLLETLVDLTGRAASSIAEHQGKSHGSSHRVVARRRRRRTVLAMRFPMDLARKTTKAAQEANSDSDGYATEWERDGGSDEEGVRGLRVGPSSASLELVLMKQSSSSGDILQGGSASED